MTCLAIAETEEQYKKIIRNITHLYDLFTTILSSKEDTQKRIIIEDTDLEYEQPEGNQETVNDKGIHPD